MTNSLAPICLRLRTLDLELTYTFLSTPESGDLALDKLDEEPHLLLA